MKVKYIGKPKMDYLMKDNGIDLIPGKIYDVIRVYRTLGLYGIIDESGEEYGYPPEFFEIVEQ